MGFKATEGVGEKNPGPYAGHLHSKPPHFPAGAR